MTPSSSERLRKLADWFEQNRIYVSLLMTYTETDALKKAAPDLREIAAELDAWKASCDSLDARNAHLNDALDEVRHVTEDKLKQQEAELERLRAAAQQVVNETMDGVMEPSLGSVEALKSALGESK